VKSVSAAIVAGADAPSPVASREHAAAPSPDGVADAPATRRGPSPISATLARLAGAVTTAVLVVVSEDRDDWIVPVFLASVAWFGVSTAFILVRGLTRGQARSVAAVDLGLIVAAIGATGEATSPVVRVLCLAPVAWAVVTDRTTTAVLILAAGCAFLAFWTPAALDDAEDSWRTLATFASTYYASIAMAYVALRLRDDSWAHAERLAAARRALSSELGQVERDERERLAVQLHDGPLQAVISARQDLVEHLDGDPDALEIGIATLDESIAALRTVATDLFPDQDGGSIVREQLRSIAAAWEARGDFEIRVTLDEAVGERSDPMLVGMVAELVGNAAKHASPSLVTADIHDEADGVLLQVTDDGSGMTRRDRVEAEQTGHIGLRSLDRRIRAVGGRLQIRSAPGQGTSVRVLLPR
jgi:two-component system NarL family sensor kinase